MEYVELFKFKEEIENELAAGIKVEVVAPDPKKFPLIKKVVDTLHESGVESVTRTKAVVNV
jgi:hypothetical protein